MFLVKKMKIGRVGVLCINSIEIYWSCQMLMEGKMIECSGCMEWYHLTCVMDAPERSVDLIRSKLSAERELG